MVIEEWAKMHGVSLDGVSVKIKAALDDAVVGAHMCGFTSITVQTDVRLMTIKEDPELQELIDLLDGACWYVSRHPECTRIYLGSDLNIAWHIDFEKRCKIGT